jgi:hypothetical protein
VLDIVGLGFAISFMSFVFVDGQLNRLQSTDSLVQWNAETALEDRNGFGLCAANGNGFERLEDYVCTCGGRTKTIDSVLCERTDTIYQNHVNIV